MAINMMCINSNCKHYWEDNCMKNMNEERLEIDANGQCITFEEGISELYNCQHSENGKCMHSSSRGELDCNGTDAEQDKCTVYNEMEI